MKYFVSWKYTNYDGQEGEDSNLVEWDEITSEEELHELKKFLARLHGPKDKPCIIVLVALTPLPKK